MNVIQVDFARRNSATQWELMIAGLDWQPIDDSHRDGRSLVVRDDVCPYMYVYWGPNLEDWGWPDSEDDAEAKWRLAGDCRIGEPLLFMPTEAAEPTDFVRAGLGEC